MQRLVNLTTPKFQSSMLSIFGVSLVGLALSSLSDDVFESTLTFGRSETNSNSSKQTENLPSVQFASPITNHTHKKPLQLYSFGRSSQGQLGLGGVGILGTPTLIDSTDEEEILDIGAGGYMSALITKDGELYTWGSAPTSIGHDTRAPENIPRIIDDLENIVDVSCGKKHIVCLDKNGQVYTTGSGYTGRLINDGSNQMTFVPVDMSKFVHFPHPPASEEQEQGLEPKNIPKAIKVAAGTYQTLVLFDNGTVFESGKKVTKRRLDWTTQKSERVSLPQKIEIDEVVTDIAAGCGASAAVTDSGNIYLWGDNSYGTIGNGRKEDVYVEKCHLIRKLRNKVKKVEIGDFHVLALLKSGEVYAWGRDRYSECGFGQKNSDQLTPKRIEGLENVKDVKAGACHSLAIMEDETLCVWGRGDTGALGIGKFAMIIERPEKLELFIGGTSRDSSGNESTERISVPYSVKKVACGTEHTLMVAEVHNPRYNDANNL